MGLLDSILGGIAGNVLGRGSGGFGRGGGRNNVLMALLPIVLSMLAKRGGGALGRGGVGGLGGLGALAGLGGLGALLSQFQQNGLSDQVQSWIGTGQNEPISPDDVSRVFDHDALSQIATQAGVSEEEARSGLSELLPQVVDQLTPQGELPAFDQLSASVDQFTQELQQRGE